MLVAWQVEPSAFLEHIENIAQLAQETRRGEASTRGVLQCQVSQQRGIMHNLQQGVGIGVYNVILEARILSAVIIAGTIESMISIIQADEEEGRGGRIYRKSKSSTPNLLYLISKFRYIGGASGFRLPSSLFDSNASDACLISAGGFSPVTTYSLAFSLRNFAELSWRSQICRCCVYLRLGF